eukprot:evm.model.scf_1838.2 EVM.evm.TU.scf_1838.2   scf_1838:8601-10031(-)
MGAYFAANWDLDQEEGKGSESRPRVRYNAGVLRWLHEQLLIIKQVRSAGGGGQRIEAEAGKELKKTFLSAKKLVRRHSEDFDLRSFYTIEEAQGVVKELIEATDGMWARVRRRHQGLLQQVPEITGDELTEIYGALKADSRIGSGGFSEVYASTWRGMPAAIKHVRLPAESATNCQRLEALARFSAEVASNAEHAYGTGAHPNIVRVHAWARCGLLIMELADLVDRNTACDLRAWSKWVTHLDKRGLRTQRFVHMAKALEAEPCEIPDDCPDSVKALIRRCFSTEPSERPTMEEVRDSLHDVLQPFAAAQIESMP